MATATVSSFVRPSKPIRVYRAHLDESEGVLTKLDGTLYFLADVTNELTEVEPDMLPFLMVHGECGLAETQRLMDDMKGGLVALACGVSR